MIEYLDKNLYLFLLHILQWNPLKNPDSENIHLKLTLRQMDIHCQI